MLKDNNVANAEPRYREAGEWLRGQRLYWQITQAELAEQAGLGGASLIDDIEQGRAALPRFMHAPVALAFSLDRDVLADHCAIWYGQDIAAAA